MKAKNLMGDEVELSPLRFAWMRDILILNVFRGDKLFCIVMPNGWDGYSKILQYDLAEPIMSNLMDNWPGFSALKEIMDEWYKHVTPEEALAFVNMKKSQEKARQEVRKML